MPDPIDVTRVRALGDYRLWLRFEDGVEGVFDVSPYLDKGVFTALRDASVFDSARVEDGTVVWPGGIDIAPERLYSDMIRG